MLRSIFPLSSLLLGVALLLLGSGLLSTLLAVRGGIEGFDSQTLGAIGAMYFVGFLAGTYLGPMMIRRVSATCALSPSSPLPSPAPRCSTNSLSCPGSGVCCG